MTIDFPQDTQGANKLRIGANQLCVTLSMEQVNQLLRYLALLKKWNQTYNLTAVRREADMVTHHLLDSLSLIPSLGQYIGNTALHMMDVGSGAGLPGVVLAVQFPHATVSCVDAVKKKTSFIQQVSVTLGLKQLMPVHGRVEKLPPMSCDVIVSRAFSSLKDFVDLTSCHLKPGGIWVAMKGKTPHEEIEQLPAHIEMFHVEPLQVPFIEAARCLIWLRRKQ
jgi:16S rRNA (guanine527-N7)-methyltransferase